MAKEGLMAANVGFNAVHQQIVFTVTRRFYELNTARQKVAVAESSLRAADTVAQAARARLENGLATKPEVLQAEQQSAQAAFELEAARGALSDAQVAFVESLGICPRPNCKWRTFPKSHFEDSADSMDDLLERALSNVPTSLPNGAVSRRASRRARRRARPIIRKIRLGANAAGRNWMSASKIPDTSAATNPCMALVSQLTCRSSTVSPAGKNFDC
jgi:outer membrane protein TolC